MLRISAFKERQLKVAANSEGAAAGVANNPEAMNIDDNASLLLPFTPVAPLPSSLTAIQEWEGYVTEIHETSFEASLMDVTRGMRYETEKAELLISDLSSEDRERLSVGAIFRWVIGYQTHRGMRQRVSQVYFRKMPDWSMVELAAVSKRADELLESLGLT